MRYITKHWNSLRSYEKIDLNEEKIMWMDVSWFCSEVCYRVYSGGWFRDLLDGGNSLVCDALVAHPFRRIFASEQVVRHSAHPCAFPMIPSLTPTFTVDGLVVVLDILTTPTTRVLLSGHTSTSPFVTRRFCFTLFKQHIHPTCKQGK